MSKIQDLYAQTEQSKDKLFIIQVKTDEHAKKDWFVVQVVWDGTSETQARNTGVYHVRWYACNISDSKSRVVTNCRFWPEIHQSDSDGRPKKHMVVPPAKTERVLKKSGHGWYQKKINLLTDALVGPFDFARINSESHRILPQTWSSLRQEANPKEVNLINDAWTKFLPPSSSSP